MTSPLSTDQKAAILGLLTTETGNDVQKLRDGGVPEEQIGAVFDDRIAKLRGQIGAADTEDTPS